MKPHRWNRVRTSIALALLVTLVAPSAFAAGAAAPTPATPASVTAAPPAPRPAHAPAAHTTVRSHSQGTSLQATATARASDDSTMTLKGGDEGTVFRSLTIEGEDRIHVEVERPPLAFDVDPATAPGLQGGSARDVLDRSSPDGLAPLLAATSHEVSSYEGRPWLSRFASGGVARFRPAVKGAVWWKLTVADARGQAVTSWEGNGDPPDEIAWDGRSKTGTPVMPGLTYSHVLEARDKAGNRRHFVGQGFQVPAYRYEGTTGPLLVFAGRELDAAGDGGAPLPMDATPVIVLEAASWLNQSERSSDPVRVTATARTAGQAQALADRVTRALAPRLLGDPSRVRAAIEAEPGAPEDGAVRIELTK